MGAPRLPVLPFNDVILRSAPALRGTGRRRGRADAAEKIYHAACAKGVLFHSIKTARTRTVPRAGCAAAQDDSRLATEVENKRAGMVAFADNLFSQWINRRATCKQSGSSSPSLRLGSTALSASSGWTRRPRPRLPRHQHRRHLKPKRLWVPHFSPKLGEVGMSPSRLRQSRPSPEHLTRSSRPRLTRAQRNPRSTSNPALPRTGSIASASPPC